MAVPSPFYMGFDLSTQQLKGIVVTPDLKVQYQAVFDFDADSTGFEVKKGVLINEAEREVYAPVALWLQALDAVLQKLKDQGLEFGRVRGISGAGMQHGNVYWGHDGERALRNLRGHQDLEPQLRDALSFKYSPNWQDSSTEEQCNVFDKHLGDEMTLAVHTGSKAHHVSRALLLPAARCTQCRWRPYCSSPSHGLLDSCEHGNWLFFQAFENMSNSYKIRLILFVQRFTGPQILRFRTKHPEEYQQTSRISLVSSFLASIFLGKTAPIDISDVCGINLWDIKSGKYNQQLMSLAAGSPDTKDLESKLGGVPEDGGGSFGTISAYFVERHCFDPSCSIAPFTGDNPSTILALPLRPFDAIVSLGTSTTFLMSTHHYEPDPAVHFFNHPTTAGLYMFMLCYKNGCLAREQIRDSLGPVESGSRDPWSLFNHHVTHNPPLGANNPSSPLNMALYFPRPEIVPNVSAGTYRFTYNPASRSLSPPANWNLPHDDPRAIVESQLLSLRLRSRNIVAPPSPNPYNLPAQPRRIYLVGGGSQNLAIARLAGEILGGVEGVYRLDVGGNACALGSAYNAVWAAERKPGETFEELIESRWKEDEFVERVAEGYQADLYEKYGMGVEALAAVEKEVLKDAKEVEKAGTSGAGQIV